MRIRYKGEQTIHKEINTFSVDKSLSLMSENQIAIFTAVSVLSEGFKAAEKLNEEGYSTALFSFPIIKPIDSEEILSCVQACEVIITMEENTVIGGFGSAVAEVLACSDSNNKAKLKRFDLNDEFPEVIGTREYLANYIRLILRQY